MRHHRRKLRSGRFSFLKIPKAGLAMGVFLFILSFLLVAWVLDYTAPRHSPHDTPFDILRTVSVPEMPDRAVSIVKAGDPARQDELIQESLKAVSVLARPGIMPFMVSGLARAFPDQLEVILNTAVDLQPDLVLIYAQSSILQLPSKAEQISYVLGRKTPWNAAAIAKTLSEETRDQKAIIRGLQRGIPEYHPQDGSSTDDSQTNSSSTANESNLITPANAGRTP